MRNIKELSPDSAQALFTAGPRKLILVENESERDILRQQFRERLSELELLVLPNKARVQHLRTEIAALSSKGQPVEIVEYDLASDDAAEVFDLRPSSTKRVTVKVAKKEPACFYFVDEDDVPIDEDITEDGQAA
jgi:hypothetical protein